MSREKANLFGAALAIIGVPSSAGARRVGQEKAPGALRAAGLIDTLRQRGFDVVDRGNLPETKFRPDPGNPTRQNLALVARMARSVALEVDRATGNEHFPVIVGGDCTVTIGVLAGLIGKGPSLGLIYIDGDLDLNTPETTPSGIFDGMVTAHLLGRGAPDLAHIGPEHPLLQESHLVYFGYNVSAGGIDPPELSALARSAALRFPMEIARQDPIAAANKAVAELERRVGRILIHFDIDITDIPAVDVAHRNGLPLDSTAEVLKIFLASPKCAGLVVTEFNPELDVDGSVARRLVTCLAETLSIACHPHRGE
jgi:arginase